jgi:hypothetical protein
MYKTFFYMHQLSPTLSGKIWRPTIEESAFLGEYWSAR